MKNMLLLFFSVVSTFSISQTNTFPSSGNNGIGTATPQNLLHLKNDSPYIRLEKTSYAFESGLVFTTGANPRFYIYTDNDGTEAMKIQASGLTGETDDLPRIQIPAANKNIYFVQSGGNVGVGTSNPQEKLSVNGKVKCEELVVVVDVADYVFESDYKLKSLKEVDSYISELKHLPGVPGKQEVNTNGYQVGLMTNKLLEKIEELTLHMIALSKQNELLQNHNQAANDAIQSLQKQMVELHHKMDGVDLK